MVRNGTPRETLCPHWFRLYGCNCTSVCLAHNDRVSVVVRFIGTWNLPRQRLFAHLSYVIRQAFCAYPRQRLFARIDTTGFLRISHIYCCVYSNGSLNEAFWAYWRTYSRLCSFLLHTAGFAPFCCASFYVQCVFKSFPLALWDGENDINVTSSMTSPKA